MWKPSERILWSIKNNMAALIAKQEENWTWQYIYQRRIFYAKHMLEPENNLMSFVQVLMSIQRYDQFPCTGDQIKLQVNFAFFFSFFAPAFPFTVLLEAILK